MIYESSLRDVPSKIEQAIRDFGMLNFTGEGVVLVALSGGPDSTLLLHSLALLANERGFKLHAAHINHLLRGDESDRDERFCRNLCGFMGVELDVLRVDAAAEAKKRGQGIEEAARDIRYAFFREVAAKCGASKTATAHNASENAETVIFNLIRGSGITGLGGIAPVREDGIIRPLIYMSKPEILEICKRNSIDYVYDSSNSDTRYSRNYIRKEIIPRCEEVFPGAVRSIARTSRLLREDDDYLDRTAADVLKDLANEDNTASPSRLCALHPAILSRVLILMYGKAEGSRTLESVHVSDIIRLLSEKSKFSLSLPGEICAVLDRGVFGFWREEDLEVPDYEYTLQMGRNDIPEAGAVIWLTDEEDPELENSEKNVYKLFIHTVVSSDKINNIFTARSRRDADCYRYGGMTRKTKKILCDAKLGKREKNARPVICDGSGILWIPGFPVRDGAAHDTKKEAESAKNAKKLHIYFASIK